MNELSKPYQSSKIKKTNFIKYYQNWHSKNIFQELWNENNKNDFEHIKIDNIGIFFWSILFD